jgi:RecB family exonuclease
MLIDPAPPLQGRRIPGGARTLDSQSACPLIAFCEARLRVEPLEPVQRGIDGRLRGILLHRVLELVQSRDAANLREQALDDGIAAAFVELLPRADATWQAQVAAEKRRIRRLFDDWLEAEARRMPFGTLAVEQRTEIEIDGWQIGSRIDRIDRLDSGDLLLIDYKTGRRASSRWQAARLGDCQLPLYAQRPGPEVAAIALTILNEEGVSYRSAGRAADAFPGRRKPVAAEDWRIGIARWREQLLELIGEFAAGDTRIPVDGSLIAGSAWAMLARTEGSAD